MKKNLWINKLRFSQHYSKRLFVSHCAGGSMTNFRAWTNLVPDSVDMSVILLPGRDHRFNEAFSKDIKSIVQAICSEIELMPNECNQDYILFGHSLGGIITFELARELRRRSLPPPNHIIIAATRAPHLTIPERIKEPHQNYREILGSFNGTPEEAKRCPELMEILSARLEADYKLYIDYCYHDEQPLACPITVLGGKFDPFISEQDLMAWQRHTELPLSTQFFEGDHFFIDKFASEIIDIIL